MDLSLIDISAPIEQQASLMAEACETTGFFLIPVSSIDQDVADTAWRSATEFFDLPTAEKQLVGFPTSGYPYGYSAFGLESLAKSLDPDAPAPSDLKESFSAGPDCGHSTQSQTTSDTAWIRSPSLWPEQPAQLRESWTAYYQELAVVCEHLMSIMAVALALPADYFASMIDQPISSMRALHYPELTAPPPDGSMRAGAHSDYGTLTILRTDDIPGLEIQNQDGTWIRVNPEPDTFVVNLGDSIAQWTNDRWRSTMHRVTTDDHRARHSLAFFHMANWDSTIECLPTCLEPGQTPRHAPAQAGPWLMQKFQATVASNTTK